MLLKEYRKFFAPEILSGCGAIKTCPSYVRNLSGQHVLLVSDRGIEEVGWTARLEKLFKDDGIEYSKYYDITPNPDDLEVNTGLDVYRENNCDLIVALGGGSAIDCAKGIGILVANGGDIHNYEGIDKVSIPMPPLICIPTTAGSSADVSQFAIITNSEDLYKMAIVSKGIVPDISIIDPELSVTMEPSLTAETGMDALTHAFEAYVSNASSPMTDLNAIEAIKCINKYLLRAINEPKDLEARYYMMLGSMYAGLAFSNASLGLVHAMAHSLGGLLDLSHGLCNSLLLEHVVGFNFSSAKDKYRDITEVFAGGKLSNIPETELSQMLIDKLQEFRRSLLIPDKLDYNFITDHSLENLVKRTLNDICIVTNPIEPTFKDVLKLYEQII